jgi:hypothetical protein
MPTGDDIRTSLYLWQEGDEDGRLLMLGERDGIVNSMQRIIGYMTKERRGSMNHSAAA